MDAPVNIGNSGQTVIYIDGRSLDRMAKSLRIEIDFRKLLKFLGQGREIMKTCYHFTGEIEKRIRTELNELKVSICQHSTSKNLTQALVSDIRQYRNLAQHFVLVGGDSSTLKVVDNTITQRVCKADIFCTTEILAPGYKNISGVQIIDPRIHLSEIMLDNAPSKQEQKAALPPADKKERVVILVDADNVLISAKEKKVVIDFFLLKRELSAGRELVDAYYYYSEPVTQANEHLHRKLPNNGYTLIPGGGRNVDSTIINHIPIVIKEKKIDRIILVSGDGDYLPTLESVIDEENIKVEIVSFAANLFGTYNSGNLFDVILLDDILPEITSVNATLSKFGPDNGLPEINEQVQPPSPVEEALTIEKSPAPRTKRKILKTQAEQMLDALKVICGDGSIHEMHLVVKIKGRIRHIDIS